MRACVATRNGDNNSAEEEGERERLELQQRVTAREQEGAEAREAKRHEVWCAGGGRGEAKRKVWNMGREGWGKGAGGVEPREPREAKRLQCGVICAK